VTLGATHAFSRPGTDFPALRVASRRQGDAEAPHAKVQDLVRAQAVKARVEVGRGASGILITPDGSRAFVAATGENVIGVIDLKSLKEVARFNTGPGPDGMAWLPGKCREGRASEDRSGLLSLRRSGGSPWPGRPLDQDLRPPHSPCRSGCCDLERLFRSWARIPIENRSE
jgi:hypothetical protein